MKKVNIKTLKRDYSITIHKINKEIVAELDSSFLDSITRDIDDTDKIVLSIPMYVGKDKENVFLPYNEVKEERYVCLDDKDFFVIKNISIKGIGKNKKKVATAYSLEHKLTKNTIKVEDLGFQLIGADIENSIFSLNDILYNETGWKLGHIDDSVRYDYHEDGSKSEKLRWQESIDTNWHAFLSKNIKEQFECVVEFDTSNKTVNLYNIDSFGDEIEISLSYDGYLKELETVGSSENLTTRLVLVGNEDMSIMEATPTGYPYIEDYSYFIDNGEMSDELILAMQTYSEMIKERTVTWNTLNEQHLEKSKQLRLKKSELNIIIGEMESLKGQIRMFKLENDTVNETKKIEELAKKNDEYKILYLEVMELENEVKLLNESIANINVLCKRETATDKSGNLIFNEALLNELKDFIYCDSYVNDSFLKVDDLIKAGRRELSMLSHPTTTWSIDNTNFMKRVTYNIGARNEFQGVLSLGNLIELSSEEDESKIAYLVGFTQDLNNSKIQLELSDKKMKNSSIRVLGDILNSSKNSVRQVATNRYLWIQQKNNRLNLDYNKGNLNI